MAGYAIDVTSPNTPPARVKLAGQNLVIGRTKEAQIFLDSRTISRRHAEMNCDPFGRWWIRDLGSHNGTLVNGIRITEHMLKPGDQIKISDFSLSFTAGEDSKAGVMPETNTEVTMVEAETGRIATLRDFESPRLAASHLLILSDFGQQLMTTEDPKERLLALCGLMVRPEFHGRSALALRASKESFTEPPRPLCEPQLAKGGDGSAPYISKTLLRTMLARNEPVLASNSSTPGSPAATPAGNIGELSIASDVMSVAAMACPIKSEKTYSDLLYVLFPPQFGTSEWLALASLAVKQFQQAETMWAARKLGEEHAAIERELSRAHKIQERLVPRDILVPGLDFAIGFTPCKWVGGDYVDLIKGPDGKILLAIADVCGKGLPAALVASSLHLMTHTAMRSGKPLVETMRDLNIYLSESLADGTFVTMLAAMLDPATGKLETVNAGHPAGLFVTPSGEVTMTQSAANMPLGLDASIDPVPDTTSLDAGSYLLMFTDGLSELRVGEEDLMGEEGLAKHVAGLVKEQSAREAGTPAGAAAQLATRLSRTLDAMQVGMANDDRTFLVARRV